MSHATEKADASSKFEAAWRDPSRPPWEVDRNPIEREKIAVLARHLDGVRSVLDAGCGGGDFIELVVRETGAEFEHVAGIDLASGALDRARATGRYHDLQQGHLDEAPRAFDRRFDLVLLSDVLYYLRDFVHATSEVSELVAPGGKLFISVAMGPKYFGEREATAIKSILLARKLEMLEEVRLDYHVLGRKRSRIPFHRVLWPQTHKLVWIS